MPGIPPQALKVRPNASPIFPSEAFSPVDSSFVSESEVISSGSLSLSIVLAEEVLYLRGFSPAEWVDRAPSLLRGTLVVRAHKPVKVKAISLTFKGLARTEWPEGIPPRKSEIHESKELHSHTWPFFNASFPMSDFSSGANMIRLSKDSSHSHRRNISLDTFQKAHQSNGSSSSLTSLTLNNSEQSQTRSRSNSARSGSRSDSPDSTRGVKGLAGRLRRAASPAPSFPKEQILHSLNLGSRRSFSKDEPVDTDTQTKGYRTFETGEYFYNFELPLPQSLPESIEGNFGSVRYALEASIDRPGAFRTKVSGTKDVTLIRCPADNNIEVSEPIAISKQWEDQLYYDIVISGKSFPIGTTIPIAFKLTPLAKIELHRVRVYITENSEYFCRDKRVHRIEPTKKFLLEERVSSEGLNGNMLLELATGEQMSSDFSTSAELELNPKILQSFPKKREILHPNSTHDNIKIHHWIKIVLRLSRVDPNPPSDAEPGKRKHYEISIESPIHLLDPHCTNSNVYLPAYLDPVSRRASATSLRPIPAGSEHDMRPIHFLRKPSIAPPPFGADEAPPPLRREPSREAPPNYDIATENEPSYVERFATYQRQRKKSRDERETIAEQVAAQRRKSRPSTILETLHQENVTAGGSQEPHIEAGPSSLSLSTSTSAETSSTISSSGESRNLQEPLASPLNSQIFASSPEAAAENLADSSIRPRYQSVASTASVDIVDQSFDPDDPLSIQLQPVHSAASSTGPGNNSSTDVTSSKLDDLFPKMYLGSQNIERTPLLGHASGTPGSRRISEASVSHGANLVATRGRFDSSADIGLRGNIDDDQMSLTSTTSLWIS